jgi:ketosteroid isomerase-like protein
MSTKASAVSVLTVALACCGITAISMAAWAQPDGRPETAIREALSKWTSDFNARDDSRICDLFARDLVYDYRGFPERGHAALCDLLHRSLKDQTKRFAYELDIKEIIVAGDIAIVRLVWTLRVTSGASAVVESKEPGLDVFRRQPDGRWKIVRFIAYEAP